MKRTTIYLTDDQKAELEALADRTRRTEAELIREGVDHVIDLHGQRRRKPGPLFAFNDPILDDPDRVNDAPAAADLLSRRFGHRCPKPIGHADG